MSNGSTKTGLERPVQTAGARPGRWNDRFDLRVVVVTVLDFAIPALRYLWLWGRHSVNLVISDQGGMYLWVNLDLDSSKLNS
jgi:hypothetical protein